jgi:hypothetical protein
MNPIRQDGAAGAVVAGGDFRLRCTNFLEEALDLVPEVSDLESSKGALLLVRDCPALLRAHDDLLLLEQGRVPAKGEIGVSLRLWTPPFPYTSARPQVVSRMGHSPGLEAPGAGRADVT